MQRQWLTPSHGWTNGQPSPKKKKNPKHLTPKSLTFPFLLLCMMLYDMDYLLINLDHLPGLLNLLENPHFIHWGGVGRTEWETEKSLTEWKHSSGRILLCYQYCFCQKSKTEHHSIWYEESELYPKNVQYIAEQNNSREASWSDDGFESL